MTIVFVLFGAAVGAPLRYLIDRIVQVRHDSLFPWGTFCANVVGCLILGGLAGAGAHLPPSIWSLLGTGFCGALTTYSTFAYETVRLVEERVYLYAAMNVVVSVVAGLGGALLGYTAIAAMVT